MWHAHTPPDFSWEQMPLIFIPHCELRTIIIIIIIFFACSPVDCVVNRCWANIWFQFESINFWYSYVVAGGTAPAWKVVDLPFILFYLFKSKCSNGFSTLGKNTIFSDKSKTHGECTRCSGTWESHLTRIGHVRHIKQWVCERQRMRGANEVVCRLLSWFLFFSFPIRTEATDIKLAPVSVIYLRVHAFWAQHYYFRFIFSIHERNTIKLRHH